MATDTPGPPAAPKVVNVQSTSCTVRYQLPEDEGDDRVTGYQVRRRAVVHGVENAWEPVSEAPITNRELVIENLNPDGRYQFQVAAENRFGLGEFGPPSEIVMCLPDPQSNQTSPCTLRRYSGMFIICLFLCITCVVI